MIVGGVAAIAVGSALLWASETGGGFPTSVAWGVWSAGIAMICAGSLRNRKELKIAAESAEQTAPSPEGPRNPAPQAGAETGMQTVEAEVPMAEMSSYTIDLRSMTQGRGSFTCKFIRYEEAPGNVQQKVIEEAKAAEDKE